METLVPGKSSWGGDEGRLRDFFQGLPCLVAVLDPGLRLVEMNRLFFSRLGHGLGRPCWEVCRQRLIPCRCCPVEMTFETGEEQHQEETFITQGGREISVMVHTAAIRRESGDISHVALVATDIGKMKRLQAHLHEAQRQLRQFFEELPCTVSVQDSDLRVVASNQRFKTQFGSETGLRCYELYKHRDEPCHDCPVLETFADGGPHCREDVVTSIAGERHNVLIHTAPLRDGEGKVTHVMEMATNITRIRQVDNQLTSLGLLIGSLSHGIKGLLTGIDGGVYLVNTGLSLDHEERVREGWSIVHRNLKGIRRFVLDILYYAKPRDLEYVRVEVKEFADATAAIVHYRSEEEHTQLVCTYDAQCGSMDVDVQAFRSALVNLLENAFDACRVDFRKLGHEVRFSVAPGPGDALVFTVTDNGIGMDRESREKAFTLFFSSKGSAGTGLGLFVAHKIVGEHGGTIEVQSEPGEGSQFQIRIPRSLGRGPVGEEGPTRARGTLRER